LTGKEESYPAALQRVMFANNYVNGLQVPGTNPSLLIKYILSIDFVVY